eukprot:UN27779
MTLRTNSTHVKSIRNNNNFQYITKTSQQMIKLKTTIAKILRTIIDGLQTIIETLPTITETLQNNFPKTIYRITITFLINLKTYHPTIIEDPNRSILKTTIAKILRTIIETLQNNIHKIIVYRIATHIR